MLDATTRCLFATATLWFAVASPAQLTIELADVPPDLVYPLPAGHNSVVTATVHGGEAEQVWLDAADSRLVLRPSAPHRYQLNLADAAVRELLRTTGQRGQFTIHARGANSTAVSAPVSYAFYRSHPTLATYLVTGEDFSVTGHAHQHTRRWLEPSDVHRIEWYFGRRQVIEPLHAQIGALRRPLSLDTEQHSATLILDDSARNAWAENGQLQIVADHEVLITFDARPRGIDPAGATAEFTVLQRTSEKLPGVRGYLQVTLGDITHGQVLVSLRSRDREIFIGKRSMRRGDIIGFELDQKNYVLSLDRLVNLWVGDDFAEFSVMRRRDWEVARIDELLRDIAASELTFLRNGRRYSGAAAAAHLRNKYENTRQSVTTVQSFIETIATRSSVSGKSYMVERADGTTLELAEWLRSPRRRAASGVDGD